MGNVSRPQLQSWIIDVVRGVLPFESDDLECDTYTERVDAEGIEQQTQLRAAHELLKRGDLEQDDYQTFRLLTDDWYRNDYSHNPQLGERSFNPFEVKGSPLHFDKEAYELYSKGEITLEEYTKRLGVEVATGRVEPAEGVKPRAAKTSDPLRGKSGQFAFGVAQLWFYSPQTGKLEQRPFVSGNIAQAFGKCAEIQKQWDELGIKQPCAWVKVRIGSRKVTANGEGIVLVDARGIIAKPQDIVRLHGLAQGLGIKSPVGERVSNTSDKVVLAMLENSRQIAGVSGSSCLDTPVVEPDNPREVVYSVKYGSGRILTIREVPLPDDEAKDIAGHKLRAFRILLDSPCAGADSAKTVRYIMYGNGERWISQEQWIALKGEDSAEYTMQTFVVSKDEAIRFDQAGHDDEILNTLQEAFIAKAKREGVTDADRELYLQARYRRLNKIDPIAKPRKGPAMHETVTRVDYGSDGRMVWQRAKNDGGPGSNWVGKHGWVSGQSYLEAQVYNM